jgi:hypothetical protein
MLRTALSCLLLAAPVSLQAQTPWIHVEVDEGEPDASKVKVNLPLSVARIALEAAPEKVMEDGRISIEHMDSDLDVEDLRRMWNELRSSGESEWVSMEKEGETVSIRQEGERILIKVDDRNKKDRVDIQVPVQVVDALFSGDGSELNLKAAMTELESHRGDIVQVDDGRTRVRIWIDEKD